MALSGTYGSIDIERDKLVARSTGFVDGETVPTTISIPLDDVCELLRRHGYEVSSESHAPRPRHGKTR